MIRKAATRRDTRLAAALSPQWRRSAPAFRVHERRPGNEQSSNGRVKRMGIRPNDTTAPAIHELTAYRIQRRQAAYQKTPHQNVAGSRPRSRGGWHDIERTAEE